MFTNSKAHSLGTLDLYWPGEPRAKGHSGSENPLSYGAFSSPSASWLSRVRRGSLHGLFSATLRMQRGPPGDRANIPDKDKRRLESGQGMERRHRMKKY